MTLTKIGVCVPGLKALSFYCFDLSRHVNTRGLGVICSSFPRLEKLILWRPPLTSPDWSLMRNFSSLVHLKSRSNHRWPRPPSSGLASQARELGLARHKCRSEGLASLALLTSLKVLNLRGEWG